ncbi:MAG: DUF924 domain-containing protein [Pseudomonadota bacterium]|nr:DUF924 domain-containing protein [Pseudomonadota bacterium]
MTVHHSPADCAPAALHFWFDEVGKDRWFAKSPELDSVIERRFGALRDFVLASQAKAWRDDPHHLLAAIILLDQFSRNIHRDSAKAFVGDPLALSLTELALDRGWDKAMPPARCQFLLMPLMHSERLADQERSLIEFERLGDAYVLHFARMHHDQIKRFGRFPGRNAALGRRSSEAEQAVTEEGGVF